MSNADAHDREPIEALEAMGVEVSQERTETYRDDVVERVSYRPSPASRGISTRLVISSFVDFEEAT